LVNEGIEELSQPKVEGLTGIGSGFYELDDLTNGWQKSDLVIIAARPAMGKTAFVMQCARNAAVDFNKPVVVFSLEMAKRQLTQRLIAGETQIMLEHIQKRSLEEWEKAKLTSATQKLRKSPLHVDDTPALSVELFRSKCIRLKKKFDIQLIIIDYLQLMTIAGSKKNGNREQEISKISAALKSVAKELNVPVIALSQLSRAVESRPGMAKRPMLSDLRESGSIEQDADQVFFLYRPEYYGITEDADGNSVHGLCELINAKNRHGATDTIKVKFIGKYTKFMDWNEKPIDESNFSISPSNSFNDDKPY
jgi:replicative DNA helicase